MSRERLVSRLGNEFFTYKKFHTFHLRAAEEKQNGFCRYIITNKVTLWFARRSACVVYTKTIIHLR